MSQQHLIDPATVPDDPFADAPRPARKRYRLTPEDCRRGGLARAKQASFYQAQLKGRDTYVERYGRDNLLKIVRKWKGRRATTGSVTGGGVVN